MRNNGGKNGGTNVKKCDKWAHTLPNGKHPELIKCATQWDYGDALSHSMRRCDKYTNTVDHVKLLQGVKTGQSVKNTPHVRAWKIVKTWKSWKTVKIVKIVENRENAKLAWKIHNREKWDIGRRGQQVWKQRNGSRMWYMQQMGRRRRDQNEDRR